MRQQRRSTEIDPPTRLAFTWIWDGDSRENGWCNVFDSLQRELEAQRPEQ